MTNTRDRLSDADQAVTAVANCIASVALGFAEAGQIEAANKMMNLFEQLNNQLLPPGHYRNWLQSAVDAHRIGLKTSGLDDRQS
ncbi:hypothetical protein [Sphingomonas sp. CFBP 8760]|uniref:hypothetical protein n=1 Tax=Sphingomonas sp. CFBP 8760 TaxID=2775282 RepID=UPI00177FA6E3|nr:hypothetical protein [Sphingomonas sp. CFBP 8760]MBD8548025.1 hypothetical protein [Sphingomonas sp. CFBP 8760]